MYLQWCQELWSPSGRLPITGDTGWFSEKAEVSCVFQHLNVEQWAQWNFHFWEVKPIFRVSHREPGRHLTHWSVFHPSIIKTWLCHTAFQYVPNVKLAHWFTTLAEKLKSQKKKKGFPIETKNFTSNGYSQKCPCASKVNAKKRHYSMIMERTGQEVWDRLATMVRADMDLELWAALCYRHCCPGLFVTLQTCSKLNWSELWVCISCPLISTSYLVAVQQSL